ncbi:hypothetical protein WG8_0608, partial [Paenibacillus sp. Aloe-11]
ASVPALLLPDDGGDTQHPGQIGDRHEVYSRVLDRLNQRKSGRLGREIKP